MEIKSSLYLPGIDSPDSEEPDEELDSKHDTHESVDEVSTLVSLNRRTYFLVWAQCGIETCRRSTCRRHRPIIIVMK